MLQVGVEELHYEIDSVFQKSKTITTDGISRNFIMNFDPWNDVIFYVFEKLANRSGPRSDGSYMNVKFFFLRRGTKT